MFTITERFSLSRDYKAELIRRDVDWKLGPLSQAVYYSRYSRRLKGRDNETWPETVIRVVEGAFEILKQWHVENGLRWNDSYWQHEAQEMADYFFTNRIGAGRSNWNLGTKMTRERGSMSLFNCALVHANVLSEDMAFLMDVLMLGVGIGIRIPYDRTLEFYLPDPEYVDVFIVPDSREGWVEATRRLIASYEKPGQPTVAFDYSLVRPKGAPIETFGGTASGPAPLIELHDMLRERLALAAAGQLDTVHGNHQTMIVADVANLIGRCVVAGNVRRSAEILLGDISDPTFMNLKNYEMYPERAEWGWLSNNSVMLGMRADFVDFHDLGAMVEGMIRNGEPGWINLHNISKWGRYGEEKFDPATGVNPCGEQPLEDHEVCNLIEVFPTNCRDDADVYRAMELATLFATIITLLPTHHPETNLVIARNRRFGVGIGGFADVVDTIPMTRVIRLLRTGYRVVERTNAFYAYRFGTQPSIRLTTSKPSGTLSQLAGVSPGVNRSPSRRYLRGVLFDRNSPVVERLTASGYPVEDSAYDPSSVFVQFPVEMNYGRSRGQSEVPLDEQLQTALVLATHWADNAVSITGSVRARDAERIAHTVPLYIPYLKSGTVMVNNDDSQAYAQAPYQEITKAEYERRAAALQPIDWRGFRTEQDVESVSDLYCTGDSCEIPLR